MVEAAICVSLCPVASYCRLLSACHCVGFLPCPGLAFNFSSFTPPLPPTPFLSWLPFVSATSSLTSPPPQVVQDLLPLIFQLRRWFLRCPNCSSLCSQFEMTRRTWDLCLTTNRSEPFSAAWRISVQHNERCSFMEGFNDHQCPFSVNKQVSLSCLHKLPLARHFNMSTYTCCALI